MSDKKPEKVSHRKRTAPNPAMDVDLEFDDDEKRSCVDESKSAIVAPASEVISAVEAPLPTLSPSPPKRVLTIPLSPSNRDRILAACSPVKVNCSLTFPGLSNPNIRFDFQAVVLIVYPACDKPDRRHVALADRYGVTGITVWSGHYAMFSVQSVGQVVKITNLTVTSHNGKRSLAMARDSSVRFLSDTESRSSHEQQWWNGLLTIGSLDISCFCSMDDDAIVSVSGILFALQTDVKRVRNEDKELLTLRIADQSGHMDLRSWHQVDSDFRSFLDKPILLQRVRVTSFAGIKIGEILDGDGTVFSSEFDGAQVLTKFWKAPSSIATSVA